MSDEIQPKPFHTFYGPGLIGSPQLEKLSMALSKAQGEMKSATKNSVNPHFKTKYADLDECWNAARGPLSTNGLAIMQSVSASGKKAVITTMLTHASGQWLTSSVDLEARDSSPQGLGGAFTYGRRYGFCAMVGITADEDDDGNVSSGKKPEPAQPRPAQEIKPGVADAETLIKILKLEADKARKRGVTIPQMKSALGMGEEQTLDEWCYDAPATDLTVAIAEVRAMKKLEA